MQRSHTKGFYRGVSVELQDHVRTLGAALEQQQRQYVELQAAVAMLIWSAPDHRLSLPVSPDPIPDDAMLRRERGDDGIETWWVELKEQTAVPPRLPWWRRILPTMWRHRPAGETARPMTAPPRATPGDIT